MTSYSRFLLFALSFPLLAFSSTSVVNIHKPEPISFEPNRGQASAEVRFVAHSKRSALFLTPRRSVLSLARTDRQLVLEMRFEGANPNPQIQGIEKLPGSVSYFLGSDPAKWRTALPRFGQVVYRNLYPGTDLIYYGNDRQLEYDFVIGPGADPRAIRLQFTGQDRVRIDRNGDLVLLAAGYELRQHKPVIYQERNGRREPVSGRYTLRGNTVAFKIGPYDASRALVIDPLLGYSSFLGGNNEDNGSGVATDSACNVYVTGGVLSTDFPTTPGTYQGKPGTGKERTIYVAKIDPDSETLIYSAYLGTGSSSGIAVDRSGNAFITGIPGSDFPVTFDQGGTIGMVTGFVAELSADGTKLLYSTTLRSSGSPTAIAVDAAGAAYVTGTASGKTLPTTPGVVQPSSQGGNVGFVLKVNSDGKRFDYLTCLAGASGNATVVPSGIAVDSSGNAYVTGYTAAKDLPTTINATQRQNAGGNDGFLFKLNATASAFLFGAYLGGVGGDWAQGVGLDAANNIYVGGFTTSGPFPTTTGSYLTSVVGYGGAAWVVKYSPDFKIQFSTYVADVNSVKAIAVEPSGNVTLTGEASFTSTLRTTPDAIKSKVDRNADGSQAWMAKLNPAGTSLLYASYFGGSEDETSQAVAVDSDGSIYITGETFSADLPTSFSPVQKSKNAGQYRDAFVSQFVNIPWFDAAHVANGASFTSGPVAPGEIITIYGFSLGPKAFKTHNITNGKFDSTLARARITFDGVPAPIVYASWTQTSVVVPYSVRGATTQFVVEYKGRSSAPVTLQVAATSPGIFSTAANGSGQGAILLEDYSVNTAQNSVPRGRPAMIFATLGGENGIDGMLAGGIAQHPLPVTATIGGTEAQVIYAGPSPGLIWGLTQVNVIVPDSAPTGSAVPIVITVGGRSTQPGVTIAVK